MQSALPGKSWVIEICPASTLKELGLYSPYKGAGREKNVARARILEQIEETDTLLIQDSAVRSTALMDEEGDALDSIIAALATFHALGNPHPSSLKGMDAYMLEGYVYV